MGVNLVYIADLVHDVILPNFIPVVSGGFHRSFISKTCLDGEPKIRVVCVLRRDIAVRGLSSALRIEVARVDGKSAWLVKEGSTVGVGPRGHLWKQRSVLFFCYVELFADEMVEFCFVGRVFWLQFTIKDNDISEFPYSELLKCPLFFRYVIDNRESFWSHHEHFYA